MPTITYTPIPIVLLGNAAQSTQTSNPVLVQDYNTISISVVSTATSSPSVTSIQASNDDGLQSAIVNWSSVSTLAGQGIFSITVGMRWLRVIRDPLSVSAASNVTFTLAGNAF